MNLIKKIVNYITILFLIFVFFIIILFIYEFTHLLDKGPPEPVIKYGEFPCVLEYEKDGKHYKIQDVVICEYDGYGIDEARGKFRKWKSHMKENNDKIILYNKDNVEVFYSFCINSSDIAESYMGDDFTDLEETKEYLKWPFPMAWNSQTGYAIDEKELYEKYGIKLTYIETSEPITNEFK